MTGGLMPTDGTVLARLAAAAVGAQLTGADPERTAAAAEAATLPALTAAGASFVTLERVGALRGCVGSLDAVRPLCRDVVRNAVRAMNDPRLPPVTTVDWPELDVKVSVLSAPQALAVSNRTELEALLRPGVDGLTLAAGQRRATFLPSVWPKLADPHQFVGALLRKGGWPDGPLPAGLQVFTYGSAEYHDPPPRTPIVV